jgi:hypothetical protein
MGQAFTGITVIARSSRDRFLAPVSGTGASLLSGIFRADRWEGPTFFYPNSDGAD